MLRGWKSGYRMCFAPRARRPLAFTKGKEGFTDVCSSPESTVCETSERSGEFS